MIGYVVSHDGRQVVIAALDERGTSHVWLARLDRPDPPRQLAEFEADSPRSGGVGDIFCRGIENGTRFIYRLREGRAPEKAVQQLAMLERWRTHRLFTGMVASTPS